MWRLAGLGLAVLLAAGCGGDVAQQLVRNPEYQGEVMAAMVGNDELAGKMLDQLISGPTRGLVLTKVLGTAELVQGLMTRMAQDRTMLDGVLNLAVQDTAMRSHVMALFKGMQMLSAQR